MGVFSKIAWCHGTVNFWWGCTKVSPGCQQCYAATLSKRYGYDEWGPGKPRRTIAGSWKTVAQLVKRAKKEGQRLRVFTNSMSDFFDSEADPKLRAWAWALIQDTAPWLDWLILTKRPENVMGMLPFEWGLGWPNVWLGVTAENQEYADVRVRQLMALPAAVRWVSYEPALGPVEWKWPGIDWIVVGGESGHGARAFDIAWARSTVAYGSDTGCPIFVKQMGSRPIRSLDMRDVPSDILLGERIAIPFAAQAGNDFATLRFKDPKGGDPEEWPEGTRVREFPQGAS